ncbi:imelysin family protein [Vannielia litorea]|uniref:Imelysin-like domain-containing protein n=1 Tax=Vannielia litorea TaxID=1217970 RepID=A0A1N6GCV4_9RHOB|nr:imelysin family protein [Vannielia litorea]SIO05314.1 hypothetical protein SAMN05444002_2380 [Vannielia litorea]
MRQLAAALALLAAPLHAGVPEAIDGHILPRHAAFAEAAAALDAAAQADCTADGLKPSYHAAFDAWIGVQHLALGPLQEIGGPLALQFWPDTKGFTARQLAMALKSEAPETVTREGFAGQSVAVQGFMALERMLYDEALSAYPAETYACALTRAIAHDIATKAATLAADWPATAEALRSAGAPGNATYLAPAEAAQALFTALIAGIEYNDDARLARPLGSFDKPRPTLAEAWRSGRSQRNLALSLAALEEFAALLADGAAPETRKLFESTQAWLAGLDEPRLAGVSEPTARMGIESLASYLSALKETAAAELGAHLDVGQGFNALDGD